MIYEYKTVAMNKLFYEPYDYIANSLQPGFFHSLYTLVSPHFTLSGAGAERSLYLSGLVTVTIAQFSCNIALTRSVKSFSQDMNRATGIKLGIFALLKYMITPTVEYLVAGLTTLEVDKVVKDLVENSLHDNTLYHLTHQPDKISNPSKIVSTDAINFALQFPFMIANVLMASAEFSSGMYLVSTAKLPKIIPSLYVGYVASYSCLYYSVSQQTFREFQNNKQLDARIGSEFQEAERNAAHFARLHAQNYSKEHIFSSVDELCTINDNIQILKTKTALLISLHNILKDDSLSGIGVVTLLAYLGTKIDNPAASIMTYTSIFKNMGQFISWTNVNFYKVADFANLVLRLESLQQQIDIATKSHVKFQFGADEIIIIQQMKAVDNNTVWLTIPHLEFPEKFIKIISSTEHEATKFFDGVFGGFFPNVTGNVTLPTPKSGQHPIIHISSGLHIYAKSTYAEVILQKSGNNLEVTSPIVNFLVQMGVADYITDNLYSKVSRHITEEDKVILQIASLFASPPPRILILDNIFMKLSLQKQEDIKFYLANYLVKSPYQTTIFFSELKTEQDVNNTTMDMAGNSFELPRIYDLEL
jgi:hypothetical protein